MRVGFIVNINGAKDHGIIENGIIVLKNLLHRGAIGGDLQTGDGAGLLFQIPDIFFREECKRSGINLPSPGEYGVGMIFMPQKNGSQKQCSRIIESTVASEGLGFLGWRNVPVDSNAIAGQAREMQPVIMQCFIDGSGLNSSNLERKLYIIRKQVERRTIEALNDEEMFYIPSMSCRTIVYKGLLTGTQLAEFYVDLNDTAVVTAMAVIHQRYSTNTFPSWELAQPFRYLAHNGEINTLKGNHILC